MLNEIMYLLSLSDYLNLLPIFYLVIFLLLIFGGYFYILDTNILCLYTDTMTLFFPLSVMCLFIFLMIFLKSIHLKF